MFHSRFNRILAVVVWLFCAAAIATVSVFSFQRNGDFIPLVTFIAFMVWVGLWRPFVNVTDDGVALGNVLSTVTVPWPALIQVETRYALTLTTPSRSYTATAAPAPGRLVSSLSGRDLKGVRTTATGSADGTGSIRPGDLPTTDSGAAAHLVRRRWESLIAAERVEIGIAAETPVTRRWHWATITIGTALLAVAIIVMALS